MRRIVALFLVAWPAVVAAQTRPLDLPVWRAGASQPRFPAYSGDEFSIRLKPAAARAAFTAGRSRPTRVLGIAAVDAALAATGASLEPEFRGERPPDPGSSATDFTAFYVVHIPPGQDLPSALSRFAALDEVQGASPIGLCPVTAVPSDSTWSQSWWLYQASRRDVHAPEAWDLTRGDSSIVVAIIDTGVIPYHPELGGTVAGGHGHFWVNPAEASGLPGVDDDGNGFIDDISGWDFVHRPFDVGYESPGEDILDADGDPNDFVGHGTIVAGLIGAITDNTAGVVGMDWNARLMPLRVGWSLQEQPGGVVSTFFIAQAVRYATLMGAKVINISLSMTPYADLDLAVDAAIASGVTVVVAAGNNGSPHGLAPRPGLVYVAATDRNDVIPIWSNRGDYVSLCAPGADMISTNLIRTGADSLGLRQPGYAWGANGTSFATPVVSGAVALLQSNRVRQNGPLLPPEQVRLQLMASCDDIAAANPTITLQIGAGRLNVARALAMDPPFHGVQLGNAGPSVIVDFTTLEGDRRIAVVTSAGELVTLDAATLARIDSHSLGIGTPQRTLAAADLGGGRGLGFFVSSREGMVGGYGGGGNPLPGWPVKATKGPLTAPALGDLRGNGVLDVVCVGPDPATVAGGLIWAWNVDGRLEPGFPLKLRLFAGDSVACALADLDGADRDPLGNTGAEIIVADGAEWIHALRVDGREKRGWPILCVGGIPAAPVVGRNASSPLVWVANPSQYYAITSSGAIAVDIPALVARALFDPALVDLDGDGRDELVVSKTDETDVLDTSSRSAPRWSAAIGVLGAPLAGHLAPGVPTGILLTTRDGPQALAPDRSLVPNFGGRGVPAFMPTLGGPIAGDRTTVFTGLVPSGWLYSFLAPEGSWSDQAQAWPTQRGNFARTGSQLGAPGMAPADRRPPSSVSDLTVTATSPTTVRLTWTAPTDDGPTARALFYELLVSDHPITELSFATPDTVRSLAPPRAGGTAETVLVHVGPGRESYARLRAVDGSGNWSELSNSADVVSPGTRFDLVVASNPTRLPVKLQWWTSSLTSDDVVTVRIHDVAGRLVWRTTVPAPSSGTWSWNGQDRGGRAVPSGLYFATLAARDATVRRKFVLISP